MEPKTDSMSSDIRAPALLHDVSIWVRDAVLQSQGLGLPSSTSSPSIHGFSEFNPATSSRRIGSWVVVTNVQADLKDDHHITLEDEVKECFLVLSGACLSSVS